MKDAKENTGLQKNPKDGNSSSHVQYEFQPNLLSSLQKPVATFTKKNKRL